MRMRAGGRGGGARAHALLIGFVVLVLVVSGCTGIRFGKLGLGYPTVRVDRAVRLNAAWTPDSRHVVVQKEASKSVTRVPMLILPLLVGCGHEGDYRISNKIFLVDVAGGARRKKLADGRASKICPHGTYIAYFHQPTSRMVRVDGKDVSFRQLWLLNYATGQRWKLSKYVEDYSFSRDGRWLAWTPAVGPWQVIAVKEPRKPQTYGHELHTSKKAGWSVGNALWSQDGNRYVLLSRRARQDEPGQPRWVRFAPPKWRMEEVGPKLSKEQREGLFGRPDHRLSGRGGVLRIKRKDFKIPDLLILPGGDVHVENLYLELADGTMRKLTHFTAPW